MHSFYLNVFPFCLQAGVRILPAAKEGLSPPETSFSHLTAMSVRGLRQSGEDIAVPEARLFMN